MHRNTRIKLTLAVTASIATTLASLSASSYAQLPPSRPYIFADATSDFFFVFSPPSLNNAGTAAFVTGSHPSDARLRVVGANGIATTVLDTTGEFSGFGFSPDINNAGQIAIEAGLKGTSNGAIIRTSVGGPTVTIAETDINGEPGKFEFFRGNPTINSTGQVAFVGLRGDSVEGVFVGNGSGAPTPLATTLNGLYDFSEEASINDAGNVAFAAVNNDDVQGIYVAGPGGLQPVMIGDSPYDFSTPDINNHGTLTFVKRGDFFTGDKVLAASANGQQRVIASSGDGDADYCGVMLQRRGHRARRARSSSR